MYQLSYDWQMPGVCDKKIGDNEDDSYFCDKKKRMKSFLLLARDIMTVKQTNCYIQFYYYNKTAREIAEAENIHISMVYRHLQKARQRIKMLWKVLESIESIEDKKETINLFKKVIGAWPEEECELMEDYYLKKKSVCLIAKEKETNVFAINGRLKKMRKKALENGLTDDILKDIYGFSKAPYKSKLS